MNSKIMPKLVGIETEYACAIIHPERQIQRSFTPAATMILQHCDRYRPEGFTGGYGYYWRNEFLVNGARLYRDHEHVEYSTPETLSARTLVAAVKAGDAILNDAVSRANEELDDLGERIIVIANNSDGRGHSYAGHLNVCVSRKTFDRLFRRSPHLLFSYCIPHLATSGIYTGAGKIGFENRRRRTRYQISQRADFIEQVGPCEQTTFDRPLVNSRDEALADPTRYARMHIICFDTNMNEYALWLKIGTMQIILAMLEAGFAGGDLTLRDPVRSLRRVSCDLQLRKKLELQDGRRLTALEIQEDILSMARQCANAGRLEGVVPEYEALLNGWEETLGGLKEDLSGMHRRIDWIAKLHLLSRFRRQKQLSWSDPSMKTLDIQYANIDPEAGLYSTVYHRSGGVDRVATDEDIDSLTRVGPPDTRAYLRSILLRQYGERVDGVDWDRIEFRRSGGLFSETWSLPMPEPFEFTQDKIPQLSDEVDWEETLHALGAVPSRRVFPAVVSWH